MKIHLSLLPLRLLLQAIVTIAVHKPMLFYDRIDHLKASVTLIAVYMIFFIHNSVNIIGNTGIVLTIPTDHADRIRIRISCFLKSMKLMCAFFLFAGSRTHKCRRFLQAMIAIAIHKRMLLYDRIDELHASIAHIAEGMVFGIHGFIHIGGNARMMSAISANRANGIRIGIPLYHTPRMPYLIAIGNILPA